MHLISLCRFHWRTYCFPLKSTGRTLTEYVLWNWQSFEIDNPLEDSITNISTIQTTERTRANLILFRLLKDAWENKEQSSPLDYVTTDLFCRRCDFRTSRAWGRLAICRRRSQFSQLIDSFTLSKEGNLQKRWWRRSMMAWTKICKIPIICNITLIGDVQRRTGVKAAIKSLAWTVQQLKFPLRCQIYNRRFKKLTSPARWMPANHRASCRRGMALSTLIGGWPERGGGAHFCKQIYPRSKGWEMRDWHGKIS